MSALLVGLVFGALLDRAGLTRSARITGVYRFSDLAVLKFLGAAIVVGAAAIQAARSLGLVASLPVVPTHLAADALGGLLFGVGMAAAGFCPGTLVAGAGVGRLDYLVAGGLGLVSGALAFGWSSPAFMPSLAAVGDLGAATLDQTLHVSGWLLVILLGELALIGFYAAERHAPGGAPASSSSSPSSSPQEAVGRAA